MKYERFKNNRFCKTFIFIIAFAVIFSILGFAFANKTKIKATTQYYNSNLKDYVIVDWENYETQTKNGMTIENQGDGTLKVYGTTTAITEFILPLTITNITSTYSADMYMTVLFNNTYTYDYTNVRLYIGYNNGQNITNFYATLGQERTALVSANYTNVKMVLRFDNNATYNNDIFTPFILFKYREDGQQTSFLNTIKTNEINYLLGPAQALPDLTKVNYIQEASNISLAISSQVNKSFGNELESLIQYTMQAGDTITVDNTGVATNEIDLLTMTAGLDIYKMTFINDNLSNDYLNILLYKNNDTTVFYNDNLGELSAGNITNFREWASLAINSNATITSASANNNNILNKIFVYSTGTNYETGYTAGYNDARQDVEEEIQEAFGEGLSQGYGDGYTTGYGEGYDQGAIEGVDSSWLINLFGAIDSFFAIHLFPNLTFGTIFAIPFVLSIAWVIIRILRGGGYGD